MPTTFQVKLHFFAKLRTDLRKIVPSYPATEDDWGDA
jgi:hypothetical protein